MKSSPDTPPARPLRLVYLEDNPLIAFHTEQLIEDLGHQLVATLTSFEELKRDFDSLSIDAALIDINLSDGPTGPSAATWLKEKGIPSLFVTGQTQMAEENADVAAGSVGKPVTLAALETGMALLRASLTTA